MDPACDIVWISSHQVCHVDKATLGMLPDWSVDESHKIKIFIEQQEGVKAVSQSEIHDLI